MTETALSSRLGIFGGRRGLNAVAARLRRLQAWIAHDMTGVEAELAVLPRGPSVVHRSAHQLLDLGGKRIRPMCVVLAARLGRGFGRAVCDLAVAVELIHSATLLHDDVIDCGERRRGAPAARITYGNAASVLAGDWLLTAGLERILRAAQPGVLERALDTLERMITAEALQLEHRGRVDMRRTDYLRVLEGKTAALFRWAMFGGATAGGLSPARCLSLERYGGHLGTAYQLVDDLLDFIGDPAATGKTLFADLREGKMTYPLLLALERDGSLRRVVERILSRPADEPLRPPLRGRVLDALAATGGIHDCLALARRHVRDAIACLTTIPEGPARAALVTVAVATVHRAR